MVFNESAPGGHTKAARYSYGASARWLESSACLMTHLPERGCDTVRRASPQARWHRCPGRASVTPRSWASDYMHALPLYA